jgi:hypothetical protein
MGMLKRDDGWRFPDEIWGQMEPLSPPRKQHALGGHNPRVSDRSAMDAILFVLRTGCQWNALNATGFVRAVQHIDGFRNGSKQAYSKSSGAWNYLRLMRSMVSIWSWLAMDGAMTKAPLGGKKPARILDRGKAASNAAC